MNHTAYTPNVNSVNLLEDKVSQKNDAELRGGISLAKKLFSQRVGSGEMGAEEYLNGLLPTIYSIVREASKRNLGMKHYDEQLLGGIAMHDGKIAEMATGEGKTLAVTTTAVLNALSGDGVHIVTSNDYLAKRDAEWMGKVYNALGLKVGVLQSSSDGNEKAYVIEGGRLRDAARKEAYNADIIYGTATEFGFDYLRDNLKPDPGSRVQRKLNLAIIDEADSILLDEARTPLIIAEKNGTKSTEYDSINPLISEIYSRQSRQISGVIHQANEFLRRGATDDAVRQLVIVKRGDPLNVDFLKLMNDKKLRKAVDSLEYRLSRDRELGKIDNQLYCVANLTKRTVALSEKGFNFIEKATNNPGFFKTPEFPEEDGKESFAELILGPKKDDEQEKAASAVDRSVNAVDQLLKAYWLFRKDADYMVQTSTSQDANGRPVIKNEVVIIDPNTHRGLAGRRYQDGLHGALEAKEGVEVNEETSTLASITIKNYFGMYRKLAGMTGTASTSAEELWKTYKLDVVPIPTHKKCIRKDLDDLVYLTEQEKWQAVVRDMLQKHQQGRPVLVGTASIEKSEYLGSMLERYGLVNGRDFKILNARNHQEEAQIVANAGKYGAITISTNMAGRGTDIILGGANSGKEERNKVAGLGGLYIIGTERHESKRVDNQLRGRAGRQGDPGTTQFYLSLQDSIMAGRNVAGFAIGHNSGQPLGAGAAKLIAKAQYEKEIENIESRKRLNDYDSVLYGQMKGVYKFRESALQDETLARGYVKVWKEEVLDALLETRLAGRKVGWDLEALAKDAVETFALNVDSGGQEIQGVYASLLKGMQKESAWYNMLGIGAQNAPKSRSEIRKILKKRIDEKYSQRGWVNAGVLANVENGAIINTINQAWQEQMGKLELLKQGAAFYSYAQLDPLIKYKLEAGRLFREMEDIVKYMATRAVARMHFVKRQVPFSKLVASGNSR